MDPSVFVSSVPNEGGLCGVSLNKSQYNQNVPTLSLLFPLAAGKCSPGTKHEETGQKPRVVVKVVSDYLITRLHMKQFMSINEETRQDKFFSHFITLIQTRSKDGPLLAGEDDTVILQRNKEANIRL